MELPLDKLALKFCQIFHKFSINSANLLYFAYSTPSSGRFLVGVMSFDRAQNYLQNGAIFTEIEAILMENELLKVICPNHVQKRRPERVKELTK